MDGCGSDETSWGADGHKRLIWHGGVSQSWGMKWNRGDVVGKYILIRVSTFEVVSIWETSASMEDFMILCHLPAIFGGFIYLNKAVHACVRACVCQVF